jgi:hypothetical protein
VPTPDRPKIHHITHIDNLPNVVDAVLWSDSERIRRALNRRIGGRNEIGRRRLDETEVACHGGTKVAEYLPFDFCPRSIMLHLGLAGVTSNAP